MSVPRDWNWSRWLRAAIAGAFIAQGLAGDDPIAYAIGAFFGIQAIFNVGCFGVGTCAPSASTTNDTNKEITYQEIR